MVKTTKATAQATHLPRTCYLAFHAQRSVSRIVSNRHGSPYRHLLLTILTDIDHYTIRTLLRGHECPALVVTSVSLFLLPSLPEAVLVKAFDVGKSRGLMEGRSCGPLSGGDFSQSLWPRYLPNIVLRPPAYVRSD